ncbi:hypothetical protein M405DRAFT_842095 [Rhizopogon salebrosus TDB-379]|nr:hypothetical protein M405DRAFT_842095 [Rhizopogon salebrosus TDB-379]
MSSIGPQIPAHFLSTVTPAEDSGEEDDYTPALPPELAAARSAGPSLSSKSNSQAPYDDDDSDSNVRPQPLPAAYASQVEGKSGVEEFLEREERRRKLQEEASKQKRLQREEWMLVPPKSGDLLASLDPTKARPRQFARNSAPTWDNSRSSLWTETPAERQQRLADEVAGRKRRAVNAEPEEDAHDAAKRRRRDGGLMSTQYSTFIVRRPRRNTHQTRKDGDKDKDKDKESEPSGIWDHTRDMSLGGRLMDPPLAVYALAQTALMTPHVSLFQRSPLLNDRAMTVSITISGPSLHKCPFLLLPLYLLTLHRQSPYPADASLPPLATASTPSATAAPQPPPHHQPSQISFLFVSAPTRNGFHTSSNRSTSTATSSSIPLTNHILTHIPTQVATLVFVLPAQNGSPLPTPINITFLRSHPAAQCPTSHIIHHQNCLTQTWSDMEQFATYHMVSEFGNFGDVHTLTPLASGTTTETDAIADADATPSVPLQEKKRAGGSANLGEREREREKEKERTREPPSPPVIATLQTQNSAGQTTYSTSGIPDGQSKKCLGSEYRVESDVQGSSEVSKL